MAINSSTLLFKFNNFYDTTKDEIFPDQVSDTTGEGEWKDVTLHRSAGFRSHRVATPAIDKDGIEWRIKLRIHYTDEEVSEHEPELQLSRRLAGYAAIYQGVNYSVESLASIKLRSGAIIDWPAHKYVSANGCGKSVWTTRTGGPYSVSFNNGVGFKRDQLMNEVEDEGSLIVKVEVNNHVPDHCFGLPKSPFSFVGNALKFLESGVSADVFFTIGEEKIPAHQLILQMQAPFLASLFHNGSTVPIDGCAAEVFRVLLSYVYGDGDPDPAFLLQHNEQVITAANKYGIIGLKLQAESVKVKYFAINESNVVQNLIFAEQMNCAIIKETCVKIVIAKADAIIGSESFRDLVGSGSADLIQDLMVELHNARPPLRGGNEWTKYNVNQLLELCIDLGLDYDGTKEMLQSRIAEYYARKEGEGGEDSEEDG